MYMAALLQTSSTRMIEVCAYHGTLCVQVVWIVLKYFAVSFNHKVEVSAYVCNHVGVQLAC